MMSNIEQDKQRSGQVEEDDEPDDWWVCWMERIRKWIAVADHGIRDKRIFSTGCSGMMSSPGYLGQFQSGRADDTRQMRMPS